MSQKYTRYRKILILFLILTLVVPALIACDDDDDEKETTQPIDSGNKEPIKIGWVGAWSGPYAIVGPLQERVISIVEDQVEEMGGILGGRMVEIITYDGSGEVSEAVAGVKKLVLEDDVLAFGYTGVSATQGAAGMETANDLKRIAANQSSTPPSLVDYPYILRMPPSYESQIEDHVNLILNVLKPKTIGFLALNVAEGRQVIRDIKGPVEDAGIDVVFEQYVDSGTADLSSQVTRIRSEKPDVLLAKLDSPTDSTNLMKQATEQGGFGDTTVVHLSMGAQYTWGLPISEGTYHWAWWYAGADYPEAKKLYDEYHARYNLPPDATAAYSYQQLWIVLNAINQSGSDDPDKIAEYARSGDLEFDSIEGPFRVLPNGENTARGLYVRIENGKPVRVDIE